MLRGTRWSAGFARSKSSTALKAVEGAATLQYRDSVPGMNCGDPAWSRSAPVAAPPASARLDPRTEVGKYVPRTLLIDAGFNDFWGAHWRW